MNYTETVFCINEKMNIIEVKNLTKKYAHLTAVDSVNFNVQDGEMFAFLGPNGAGKTTTIKILTTLLSPTSGTATINGFDVCQQTDEVRGSFGIVFQDPSLDDKLTAEENLRFQGWLYNIPAKELKERIPMLLEMFELKDRAKDLVEQFSGGMKRRLEVARGLLHKPKILFLDEPTIGLDPQTRNKIWEYLRGLKQKEHLTIFYTTHYMDEAEFADKVIIIDHGKIIANGTPAELKTQTNQTTLNDVFLFLTGKDIREVNISTPEKMKGSFGH
jgi:ABC-2 type transport system ATP-binding protein